MDLEKIMPLFRELSEDAKINWKINCNKRTKSLSDKAIELSSPEDIQKIIQIIPNVGKKLLGRIKANFFTPYISLKNLNAPWSEYHMAFCWNNVVLDPSYGQPIEIAEYIPDAFNLKNSPETQFHVCRLLPRGIEHEKTYYYDSRNRLVYHLP